MNLLFAWPAWFTAHPMLGGIVAFWTFSALAYSLPEPTPSSSALYVTLYRLIHFVAANLALATKASPRVPEGSK